MAKRRYELRQTYVAWKDMIAEKYLQIFLFQIGVPFEARGWLSKTDKNYNEISDVLLEQEDWYEIIELIIGMEYWPLGHKFPAKGHVWDAEYSWSELGRWRTNELRVRKLVDSYYSTLKVTQDDYYVLNEDESNPGRSYRLSVFTNDGRLKTIMHKYGRLRLCFNKEFEGVHYLGSYSRAFLFAAERTNSNSKDLFEGRRPDP